MSPDHFKKQDFESLLVKALKDFTREEIFFSNTTNEKIIVKLKS